MRELFIGDRVKIVDKTMGCSLDDCKKGRILWEKGDVAYITEILRDGSIFLSNTYFRTRNPLKAKLGVFSKDDLELVFYVGDKVKLLGKTYGKPIETTPYKVGEIKTIEEIDDYGMVIFDKPGDRWYFYQGDVKLIEPVKEEIMNYKFITAFSYDRFLYDCRNKLCNATERDQDSFFMKLKEMGIRPLDKILMTPEFEEYFTASGCFVRYLVDQKYVEKINKFKPFTLTLNIKTKEEFKEFYDCCGKGHDFGDIFNQIADEYERREKEGR